MSETLAVEIRALAQVVEDEVASMRTRRSVAGDLRTIADRVEQEQVAKIILGAVIEAATRMNPTLMAEACKEIEAAKDDLSVVPALRAGQ